MINNNRFYVFGWRIFLDFFGRIEDPTLFVEFYGFLIAPVTILRTSILVLVLYVTFGDRILRNYYVGDRDTRNLSDRLMVVCFHY